MTTHTLDGQYTTDWNDVLAARTQRMGSSVIRELLKLTMQPNVISFAGGLPAPEVFPVREFKEACAYVLENQGPQALQYGPTEGYPPLKQYLAESMQKYGVPAQLSNILITNGSQQALDLIGKIFIDRGDKVIVGKPTYLGAIQAWNPYGPQYVGVALDDDGMRMDILEDTLRAHPDAKFIYVLPNFHNPAGTTLPLERRKRLVELAAKHGQFIVEDDPYGQLRFEGEDITPISVLHKENTLYLSTFSKTLSPGMRVGWVVAPEGVIARLVQAKQGTDLHTSTFVQMIASDIANRGLIRQHVRTIRDVYRERRDVMLDSLAAEFPEGCSWTRPHGGLFLWARLPGGLDSQDLLNIAVQERVAFVPGHAFYTSSDADGRCCMRLNFSNAKPDLIREGVARLGRAIRQMM
jgi:2-aminoadipate transaminase